MHWVYILRCSDDTLYVGHTSDVSSREQTHNDGRGGRYTAKRRPVHVVYSERHALSRTAVARERQLKRWTTSKKEALIAGNRDALKRLSKSRQLWRVRTTSSQRPVKEHPDRVALDEWEKK